MNNRILVVYKSVTGFTRQYAEWIAGELDCACMDLHQASEAVMSEFDTIVFGGRYHAGSIGGLKKAKRMFEGSQASKMVVFATGAMPAGMEETIQEGWKNNLTTEELQRIPHFYMPGGLRYEAMSFGDKMMIKAFAAMLKNKKNQTEKERETAQVIAASSDLSSKTYITPLVSLLKKQETDKGSL